MLELDNVTVGYGEAAPVLAGISMALSAGERALICGAAGGGKTTLLNTAAGVIPRLVNPGRFSGSVALNGVPLNEMSRDSLFTAVGVVMQNVEDQLWDLSVEDLIAFPLENRGAGKPALRSRLKELLGALELDALRGRRVLTLSGGERRMVAIAAALAAAPSLLVLDEPTTGLDPAARARLARVLRTLKDVVAGMLVAEQDATAFDGIADSVSFLVSGKLSSAQPMAAAMQQSDLWTEAGILPPRRAAMRGPAAPVGPVLVSASGVRTRLKRSDGTPVLQDVSFDIRAGEVLALVGRNGAGKTTLFQSILGLAEIEVGRVRIGNDAADDWTVARRARAIAYLPQNMRRILFNMTVMEEVLFAVTAGRPADDQAGQRARDALAKYGLSALAEVNPFALSSRQQALLGLACAEAAGAPVAILDEPLLARDLHGRHMLDLFIASMIGSGRAVMLISHDLDLVEEVASRLLILDGGRITFDGRVPDGWNSAAFGGLGWPAPAVAPRGAAA